MSRSKCYLSLPEREFVKLAQNGLNFELRKNSKIGLFDFFRVLPSKMNFLGKKSRGRIPSRGTIYQDQNVEANALDPDAYLSDSDSEIFDKHVAELIAGKPYTCKALA